MPVKNVPGARRTEVSETNGTTSELHVGELIRQRTASLSPAERKLSRTLLAAYPIAGLESVAKLAERAGVSPPTVTRFIAKLGFGGYPEFQNALRLEVQARLSSPVARYGADQDTALRSALEAGLHNLRLTQQQVSEQEFEATADLLADRRHRLLVLGGRVTGALARHLAGQLQLVRPGVQLITAGRTTPLQELVDLRRRDVLVLFDYRRYQPDTVGAAREAAARGARVVLFTDPWLSPAASFAGHVLVTSVETAGPFDSLVGALAVVEALVGSVLARLGPAARERMLHIEELRSRDPWD